MNEKINTITKWIVKGDHDLGTAKITFLHISKYKDTIAFHCQQAVEKYLKGLLVHLDLEFRPTHDLIYLLELINQKIEIATDIFDKASSLEDFSVEIRYPDSTIELSDEDIKDALSIAKFFRDFIIKIIGLNVQYDEILGNTTNSEISENKK